MTDDQFPMDDEDLLALVRAERASSIGFEHDAQLTADREKALNYYKGEMPDVVALPNRSAVTTSDISDAIDTILPDLVEIFTGGDDVATFIPRGQEDEEGAQQETDYVNHVVFNENPGWLTLFSMFKDALQVKTGVVKFWAEECPPEEEEFKGQTAVALQMAAQDGEITELAEAGQNPETGEPLYDFSVTKETYKKVKIATIPPEDFTVAADTVGLADATYCAMRSRPRAQDLISQGFDQDAVDALSAYGRGEDDTVSLARDTAGEHDNNVSGSLNNLRRVEIIEHVIRIADAKGSTLYSLITGNNEGILLRKEEIERVPFAAITPFIVTHRFHGQSVADRLMEIQKINTALTRMALDSGYFALNQRMYVDTTKITADTIPNLLRNEPGVPILGKGEGAVTPIQAGTLSFPVFEALEYFQTKAEQRTGIVRAAQGLTPDTLHDTAKGALALLTAAQKRVRLIARVFAETGVKELFLGVHALIREHVTQKAMVRLRNKWVEVDPTTWGARSDMTIEIGLGASGKEAEMLSLQQEAAIMQQIVAVQGGPTGPVVTMAEIYALAKRMFEKLGNKAPEKYLKDPADPNNQHAQQPPPPDPKMAEVQGKLQLQEQEMQGRGQLQAMELQGKGALEQEKLRQAEEQAIRDHDLKVQQVQAELQLKREIATEELNMKRELLVAELQMKREQVAEQNEIARENNAHRNEVTRESNSAKIDAQVNVGGEPG